MCAEGLAGKGKALHGLALDTCWRSSQLTTGERIPHSVSGQEQHQRIPLCRFHSEIPVSHRAPEIGSQSQALRVREAAVGAG